jgi:hypothetical protein
MDLIKANKYILNQIFSYLDLGRQLNIIKYNKKLMSKLEITQYTIQKHYFNSIIIHTPSIIDYSQILIKNKIFNEKTLNKLKSEWETETSGLYGGKEDIFTEYENKNEKAYSKNIKCLNINLKNVKMLQNKLPDLFELNLSSLINIELPCSLLVNLKSLSLKNISELKFVSKDKKISLNKLKHLYLDNISFAKNQNLVITVDNLEYLDLRFKEREGSESSDDEEEMEEEKVEMNNFIKNDVFEKLIKIFNFQFLSKFVVNEKFDEDEVFDGLECYKTKFKNPEALFEEDIITKLNYFNFEIFYYLNIWSGSSNVYERLTFNYLFSKTKEDKYLFKTIYNTYKGDDDYQFEINQKETRLCNQIKYNEYYFINRETKIGGYGIDSSDEEIELDNINSIKITSMEDIEPSDYLSIFNKVKKNNTCLKAISLECLEIKDDKEAKTFIENMKKFKDLKFFYIKNDCILPNSQLIQLLTILSKLKNLFEIEINFKKKLNLKKDEKEKIHKLFPDISIKEQKISSIKWSNSNAIFNIN